MEKEKQVQNPWIFRFSISDKSTFLAEDQRWLSFCLLVFSFPSQLLYVCVSTPMIPSILRSCLLSISVCLARFHRRKKILDKIEIEIYLTGFFSTERSDTKLSFSDPSKMHAQFNLECLEIRSISPPLFFFSLKPLFL